MVLSDSDDIGRETHVVSLACASLAGFFPSQNLPALIKMVVHHPS